MEFTGTGGTIANRTCCANDVTGETATGKREKYGQRFHQKLAGVGQIIAYGDMMWIAGIRTGGRIFRLGDSVDLERRVHDEVQGGYSKRNIVKLNCAIAHTKNLNRAGVIHKTVVEYPG